jgi:hypothetical protein
MHGKWTWWDKDGSLRKVKHYDKGKVIQTDVITDSVLPAPNRPL